MIQPPSGGCVLKLNNQPQYIVVIGNQPPSGGCVLKLLWLVCLLLLLPSRLRAAVC